MLCYVFIYNYAIYLFIFDLKCWDLKVKGSRLTVNLEIHVVSEHKKAISRQKRYYKRIRPNCINSKIHAEC